MAGYRNVIGGGLAAYNRKLIGKAEGIDSPQREVVIRTQAAFAKPVVRHRTFLY